MTGPTVATTIDPLAVSLMPIMRHSDVIVWHVPLTFADATSRPTEEERFRKRVIGDRSGGWSVAEIEPVRRLRNAGWPHTGWHCSFRGAPVAMRDWILNRDELPAWVRKITEAKGGWPDVIAWRGESLAEAVFVEYKGPKDRVEKNQEAWFRAALEAGVPCDHLAVARWRAVV